MVQIGRDFDSLVDNPNAFHSSSSSRGMGERVMIAPPQYVPPSHNMPNGKGPQRHRSSHMNSPRQGGIQSHQKHMEFSTTDFNSPNSIQEDMSMPNYTSPSYSSPNQKGRHKGMDSSDFGRRVSPSRGHRQTRDINQNWSYTTSPQHGGLNTNTSSTYPSNMPGGHFNGQNFGGLPANANTQMSSSRNRSYDMDTSVDTEIPIHVNTAMSSPQSAGQMMSSPGGFMYSQGGHMHSPGGQSDMSFESVPSAFNSPFPSGKTPIDIPVHSPSPSEGSHDSLSRQQRVREVRTAIPQQYGETPPKEKKFLKKVCTIYCFHSVRDWSVFISIIRCSSQS